MKTYSFLLLPILILCTVKNAKKNRSKAQKNSVPSGIQTYSEEQKGVVTQNAVDLYTDMMRCSLYCYRELILRIIANGDLLKEDAIFIHPHTLESDILKIFQSKLTKIEQKLHSLNADHKGSILECPFFTNNKKSRIEFEKLFKTTPEPLKIVLILQLDLLKTFGLTDQCACFVDEIVKSPDLQLDGKLCEFLVFSAVKHLNQHFRPFINDWIENIKIKQKQATSNSEGPFTPFDVKNLMAHGADRFHWADKLIESASEDSNLGYLGETLPNSLEEQVERKMVNLIRELSEFMSMYYHNMIFNVFMDEKNLTNENREIFEDCESKLKNILGEMINQTLNHYEECNLLLSVPRSIQFIP